VAWGLLFMKIGGLAKIIKKPHKDQFFSLFYLKWGEDGKRRTRLKPMKKGLSKLIDNPLFSFR